MHQKIILGDKFGRLAFCILYSLIHFDVQTHINMTDVLQPKTEQNKALDANFEIFKSQMLWLYLSIIVLPLFTNTIHP